MSLERTPATASLPDVLDRILDRGVTLDPWLRATEHGLCLEGQRVTTSTDPVRTRTNPAARRARARRG